MTETIKKAEFNGHQLALALNEVGGRNIVIFCHGYRGNSTGPNRFFVRAARQLAEKGISSLRFDQYGSGNSEGDFFDSSFNDWVKTIESITEYYHAQNFHVALLGQSMGGAAAIVAASRAKSLTALVCWAPDPNIDQFKAPKTGVIEENGQIVKAEYWREAHDAQVTEKLKDVKCPAYIVQCSEDEYVDSPNRQAIESNAQTNHLVETLNNYSHSRWSFKQSEEVINKSIEFLMKQFKTTSNMPKTKPLKSAKLYTDGGARGNPGPAAGAYVICKMDDTVVEKSGLYLGETTNNQAEYRALQAGLDRARQLGINELEVYMDSELVVKQINGQYKVKNAELLPIYDQIKQLEAGFNQINFHYVPRALNKLADAEVNRILDDQKS